MGAAKSIIHNKTDRKIVILTFNNADFLYTCKYH